MSDVTMKENHGTAYYTTRDLLLYAVGIGCTSTEPSEMKYLYERDVQFRAFATFPLALPFRATMTSNHHNGDGNDGDGDGNDGDNWNKTESTRNASRLFGMPVFPPPMMDPFPTSHSVNTNTNTNTPSTSTSTRSSPGPIIHLSQKFRLHRSVPLSATIPVEVDITTHIVSIVPHKRGSIIITETRYVCTTGTPSTSTATSSTGVSVRSSKGGLCPATAMGSDLLATSQSAVLYPQKLEPISASTSTSTSTSTQTSNKNSSFGSTLKPIKFDSNCSKGQLKSSYTYAAVKRYTIGKDQALLYRLSGDTNGIHVEGSPALFHTARPILHGLCTLGYAVRAVLCSISDGESKSGSASASASESGVPICQYVECRFKKPVFVGDELEVRIWNGNGNDSGNDSCNGAQSSSSSSNNNEHAGGESASVSVESAYFFEIRNAKCNTIVVDRGIVGVGVGDQKHELNSKL